MSYEDNKYITIKACFYNYFVKDGLLELHKMSAFLSLKSD